MKLIDPELLRTFLAFAEGGSLARAAQVVARTPSAVTTQMQRLEEVVGGALLAPAGRGRVLTPLGEELVIHARRILDANRAAWLSLAGTSAAGTLALGVTQDFAQSDLPRLLRAFAASHPRVRLDLRVGRSAELASQLVEGAVDVAVVMRGAPTPDEIGLIHEPMVWLAAEGGLATPAGELPLALLDAPCGFRSAALSTLEAARRPYRIAASSGSLSGLCAAVSGGIALTLRTRRLVGSGMVEAPAALALPAVPEAIFAVRLRADAGNAARVLGALLLETFGGTPP
jgi:DNA-binding transcriptional LysR family regulator